jgi:hypothetical protein
MNTTIRSYFAPCVAVAALFAIVLCTSSVQAGLVSFDDIIQSNQTNPAGPPVEPYGAPDTSTPNKLIFAHPDSFAATAVGANGVGVIDGFLTFSVTADPDTWATGISLMESGSWSLIPTTNSVGVRGSGSIRITEVDGLPVAGPVFPILFSEDFNQGNTPPDSQNWVGGFAQGFGSVNGKVTAFDVSMNNRLFALSESGFSFIDKKNIMFMVRTEMIPEPSTALLGFIAFGGLGLITVRRRG